MSIRSLFFEGIDYYTSDFVKPYKALATDNIVQGNDFAVTPNNPNNMTINVSSGKAFINGYYVEMDTSENIYISANTSGYNRIDLVCLKLDINSKQTIVTVLQGMPSASPQVPTIPTVDGVYYLPLAQINTGHNINTIGWSNIKNYGKVKEIVNFNSALTEGEYIFRGIGLVAAPNGLTEAYGKLRVIVSDGGIHNNFNNWIWQIALLTNGQIWFRCKSNDLPWGAWGLVPNTINNELKPPTDNYATIGSASYRWSTVFAGTGVINTSDRNYKQQINLLEDRVLDAWSEVNYCKFKFNDAVAEKGENARWHIGLIAQDIEDAFCRHNLDAFEYGLLCRDVKEDGTYIYSIRSDEAQFLEMALMRRELNKLKGL